MNTIKTNDRFDRLTNLNISTHYRDREFYLLPCSVLAAFAYWVTAQNPNKYFISIIPSLNALEKHVLSFFKNAQIPEKFTYDRLQEVINDNAFESIEPIMELNRLKPNFIDLGALARNV
ncbi:hypothetical protein LCGC14_1700640, partial [marine sediment metagenome]